MKVHGLRAEFQPSNFSKVDVKPQESKAPEVIKPSTGEHKGIASVNKSSAQVTGLGQNVDTKT